jgi:signal transduction histidine kinase
MHICLANLLPATLIPNVHKSATAELFWQMNTFIMVAFAGTLLILLFLNLVHGSKHRHESERLRELLLKEQQRGRQVVENVAEELGLKTTEFAAERRQANAANAAKSQFLVHMSNELQTTLSDIVDHAGIVQKELNARGINELLPELQKINAAARHQLELVNDILALSKAETSKMAVVVEEFEVEKLVNELAATVEPLVAKYHNRLQTDCPAEIGSIRGDQITLRQVLLNLLSNACEFTEHGFIQLRVTKRVPGDVPMEGRTSPGFGSPDFHPNGSEPTEQSDGRTSSLVSRASTISFIIRDTGAVMTPEQQNELFQSSTQSAAKSFGRFGRTGCGLALSRKLCQLMDGELTVASEYGKGSIFTVEIPCESNMAGFGK